MKIKIGYLFICNTFRHNHIYRIIYNTMDEKYGDDDYNVFSKSATDFKPNIVVRKDLDEDEDAKSESGSETSHSENKSGDGSDSDEDSDNEEEPKHIFIKPNEATQNLYPVSDDDEGEDEDEDDEEDYLQKFDESLKHNVMTDYHPEMQQHNYDEIESLSIITKDNLGVIIDPLHKTLPFLTKYEKARVLGERAKQINAGAAPFIKIDNNVIDGYLIALSELEQKAIPFILKRPLPNGGCEYWKLRDLEILV